MNVKEMIEKLHTLPQDLPVYYVMFDDGYNIVELCDSDVLAMTLEDKDGKEFNAVVFGEGWLI